MRLDQYLFAQELAPSRERARAMIMAGIVYVNETKAEKAGQAVAENAKVSVRGKDHNYVSRGGLKLEKAMKAFLLEIKGKVCMDVGASTGGFTDCMLQNGATKVYAVDVGYGQLAWKLRCDENVICMERTNIRHVIKEDIADEIAFFSVDVSFISLKHIFPVMQKLTSENAQGVCLIKPQFEAGRENVGKKGVVKNPAVHAKAICDVASFATANGFSTLGLEFSPIKGPEGNIEFLLFVQKSSSPQILPENAANEIAALAQSALQKTSTE